MKQFKPLYQVCWNEMQELNKKQPALLDSEGTPILFFGDVGKAKLITAGLNPSEDEFRDKQRLSLVGGKRRFLHSSEVTGELQDTDVEKALLKASCYFHGNPYTQWFGKYDSFLEGAGVSFKEGTVCHTDYFSPFATAEGLSTVDKDVAKHYLLKFGLRTWKQVLNLSPNVEVVFGHGQGHSEMPGLFGFKDWTVCPVPFADLKFKNPLLFKDVTLDNGKAIKLYWWCPNLNGHGLSILTLEARKALGEIVGKQLSPTTKVA